MYSIGFHDGMEYENEEASIVLCFIMEWSMGMRL